DLIVRGAPDLEHEDQLIDARRGPALHLAAHAVGVAADGHPVFQEIVVRIAGHALLDPRHALGGAEPHAIQRGVVLAVVEARGGAAAHPPSRPIRSSSCTQPIATTATWLLGNRPASCAGSALLIAARYASTCGFTSAWV